MAYSTKRRFVAGAVCPRCSAMDKLVVFNEEGKDYRECVSCGFKEEMRLNIAASELSTRVNHHNDAHEGVQVVTIVSLDDSKK